MIPCFSIDVRYAFKFAYDGMRFHGYARQPRTYTVEGSIVNALENLGLIIDAKISRLRAASRTDKGVSALGNVIAFDCYYDISKDILEELNKELNDIWFYGIKEVDQRFYPRFAKLRHYRYYLKIRRDFDFDLFLKGSNLFVGEHDFRNFTRFDGRKTIREIKNILIESHGNVISINFLAQTFIWQQVRRIVSALEKLAYHEIDMEDIERALKNPDEKSFFGIAKGENLILVDVRYDFDFVYNKRLKGIIKEVENRILDRLKED